MNMGPHTVCRYRSREAANAVKARMQPLTNAKLSVLCRPVAQAEADRGVGHYTIEYDGQADCFAQYRISRCADQGLILALADALRQANPNHPLLNMWMLKPENRSHLAKYRLDDGA